MKTSSGVLSCASKNVFSLICGAVVLAFITLSLPAHGASFPARYYGDYSACTSTKIWGNSVDEICQRLVNKLNASWGWSYFTYTGYGQPFPYTQPQVYQCGIAGILVICSVIDTCPGCDENVIKLTRSDGSTEDNAILDKIEPGNSTNLIARVYDQNNQLVPNVGVRLALKAKQDSGGHHHGDNTVAARTGTMQGQQVLTGNTWPNGQGFSFTYNAPSVSGDIDILATCTGGKNCTPQGPKQVWVGVKDLHALTGSSVYVLLPNDNDPQHPDNHFMTDLAAQRVAVLAALYHGKFPTLPVLHLNDSSLIRGGVFDLDHDWDAPHDEHRRGSVVDIRANEKEGAIPRIKSVRKEFQRLILVVGGDFGGHPHFANTPREHYHVRLLGVAE